MLTYNALGIGPPARAAGRHPWCRCASSTPTAMRSPPARRARSWRRGPIVTSGYHDRPELNAERLPGGWWHTSDLGRREPDGSITFVAPLTRMVKSAAENIYPAEVEGCLASHPAVRRRRSSASPTRSGPSGSWPSWC